MAKKMSKVDVGFSGLLPTLLKVLEEWRPPSLKTELDYRNALFEYLHEMLPEDARLEKEYRHHGTTSDLYLSWKGLLGGTTELFFELKRNLKKKVEFDRLVGQIEGLDPRRHHVIVVLIGQLDASWVGRLRERYNDSLERRLSWGHESKEMLLVEVP